MILSAYNIAGSELGALHDNAGPGTDKGIFPVLRALLRTRDEYIYIGGGDSNCCRRSGVDITSS